ncbi:hypothetical protein Prudu_010470 [Prunus dulcis]|uniref:Uncharacterized protein n=1 Tax=Prunus dulcis TaxID=3755 RepID=A0A4Y1R8E6_PRUDU|nr:hypothetical protein Prudu_010470 [Prunus dulcis]
MHSRWVEATLLPTNPRFPLTDLSLSREFPEDLPAEAEIPEGNSRLRLEPDQAKAERSSGSENRPSRLAPLDFGQEFFKTSLEDILHEHSVSARGRVYDDISFNAAKLKLQSLMLSKSEEIML